MRKVALIGTCALVFAAATASPSPGHPPVDVVLGGAWWSVSASGSLTREWSGTESRDCGLGPGQVMSFTGTASQSIHFVAPAKRFYAYEVAYHLRRPDEGIVTGIFFSRRFLRTGTNIAERLAGDPSVLSTRAVYSRTFTGTYQTCDGNGPSTTHSLPPDRCANVTAAGRTSFNGPQNSKNRHEKMLPVMQPVNEIYSGCGDPDDFPELHDVGTWAEEINAVTREPTITTFLHARRGQKVVCAYTGWPPHTPHDSEQQHETFTLVFRRVAA